jgi:predicted CopG family antitoxin
VTLRSLPSGATQMVRRKAGEEGTSISGAIIRLLERSARVGRKKQRVNDVLDFLAGSWSGDEAAEFEESLRQQRTIDADMWAE